MIWKARFFSDGQKGKIHSVSELREIPMHGGGSDLAAGLNHVMRAPRGSESLSEQIDFTPKGDGGGEGKGGKANQGGGVIQVVTDTPVYMKKKSRKFLSPFHVCSSRHASKKQKIPSPVYPVVLI